MEENNANLLPRSIDLYRFTFNAKQSPSRVSSAVKRWPDRAKMKIWKERSRLGKIEKAKVQSLTVQFRSYKGKPRLPWM